MSISWRLRLMSDKNLFDYNNIEFDLKEIIDRKTLESLIKKIEKSNFTDILLTFSDYERWEVNRYFDFIIGKLDTYSENISETEIIVIFKEIIKVFFNPKFPKLLKKVMISESQQLHLNLSIEGNKFYKKLTNWIIQIIEDNPDKLIKINNILSEEYQNGVNNFSKDSLSFRGLKDIENDYKEVAARQILITYGNLVESRYRSYLELIYKIYCTCGVIEKEKPHNLGKLAKKINNLFYKYYPNYKELIDPFEVTIRNANAHNNYDFNDNYTCIVIYNKNKNGERIHEKQFTIEEFTSRFYLFCEKHLPIGSVYISILYIKIYYFLKLKYIDKLKKLIKNERDKPEIQKFISD